MNFQGLAKIEKPDFYLDLAFKRAKEAANLRRQEIIGKKKTKLDKSKVVELARVNAIKAEITKLMSKILESYPSLDGMAEFYREMVRAFLDYAEVKKALGSLGWAIKKTNEFSDKYKILIKKCEEQNKINAYRKEFYGRASSILKQIRDKLALLENSRQIMLEFPAIKQNVTTIALAGFPNVGKSTLLAKLTPSKPEIKAYAFTTKRINIGYMKKKHEKIQFMDVPGTLNRINKMNPIEHQAYLAIKYCADKIIYVFDLTESTPMEKQIKLYKRLKDEYFIPMYVYFSKQDLLKNNEVEDFIKSSKLKFKVLKDVEEIKEIC